MPAGAEGFDTNGRPDDLLKRITYNSNNFGKGAFLFADADACIPSATTASNPRGSVAF